MLLFAACSSSDDDGGKKDDVLTIEKLAGLWVAPYTIGLPPSSRPLSSSSTTNGWV